MNKTVILLINLILHVQIAIGQIGEFRLDTENTKTTAKLFEDGRFQMTYEKSTQDPRTTEKYVYQEGYWHQEKDTIKLDVKGKYASTIPKDQRAIEYYKIQIEESYRREVKGIEFEFQNKLGESLDLFKISIDRGREKRSICSPGVENEYAEPIVWSKIKTLEYFRIYRKGQVHQEYRNYYPKNRESNHFKIIAEEVITEEQKRELDGWAKHLLVKGDKLFEPYYYQKWTNGHREQKMVLGGFDKNKFLDKIK